ARWGRGEIMDLLLDRGADASVRDDRARTLLHYAAQYNHVEVMRSLLAHGFDVDVPSRTGDTPLHSAAFMLRRDATRLLLDHGADPNRHGNLGWTPLHVAASGSPRNETDAELVRMLLDHGADPNIRTRDGCTPLVFASQAGDTAVIHLLIARGGWSGAEHGSLVSPLRSAVNAGDATAARLLLDGGADANERYDPRSGETMLHRAAKRPGLDLARTLLGHGADPNLTDAGGRAPLHVAAGEGNEGMIRMLLAHRAKV